MFGWLRKKNKNSHSEDCLNEHVVSESKFEMVSPKGKRTIVEISELLPTLKEDEGSIGFYVVSKCIHRHNHNNRILLWWESERKVLIEVQRPQDLCLCSSYYKTVPHSEFESALSNMSEIITSPEKRGFTFEAWS